MKVNIIPVTSGDDLTSIGDLFEEYQSSLGIDLEFQAFEQELKGLPGDYAPPLGCLWLAKHGDSPAGCVALRPIDKQICEMKRLFVRPEHRALGFGRMLARQVIVKAKEIGYMQLYLDTLPTMVGAQKMYESLGFQDIAPYRKNPIEGSRFLCLDLTKDCEKRD